MGGLFMWSVKLRERTVTVLNQDRIILKYEHMVLILRQLQVIVHGTVSHVQLECGANPTFHIQKSIRHIDQYWHGSVDFHVFHFLMLVRRKCLRHL